MNRTAVSRLRRISLGWRGHGRGALLCVALIAAAAMVVFFSPQSRRSTELRASASPKGAVRIVLSSEANRNAARNLADMGWAFEPNVGQSSAPVKFLARAHDATIFLTEDSVYVSWFHATRQTGSASARKSDVLQLQFANANPATAVSGESLLPGKINYLIGRNPQNWHTNVPHFRAVRYADLYPGVAARFYGGSQSLEYDLAVASDADLRRIRLRVHGAEKLWMDARGNLRMRIGPRELTVERPQIYQTENGARAEVSGGYQLLAANEIGFEIGKHRPDLPLVIDPTISIAYTTFLGGAGAEKGNSVAVDSSGNVYVGGTTTIAPFSEPAPAVSPTSLGSSTGSPVLFVAKVDPNVSGAGSLIYLTFVGGSLSNQGGMVALDNSPALANPGASPNLAILGWTTSTDFPVTNGSVFSGTSDLTITDLNGAGSALVYSEYFGGSGAEATQGTGSLVTNSSGGGIATDSSGDVFITSDTNSSNLPTTSTAFTPTFTGPSDGVLAEFASGTGSEPAAGTLLYCTYLGINTTTVGSAGVAVDNAGNAYIAGFTSAPTVSTISFTNTFQGTYPGGSLDGFVMEIGISSTPSRVVYGGFIGGSQQDEALSIAVDTSTPADAYVTGLTQSSNLIPAGVTNSPFQSSLGTGAIQNGFFAVINQSSTPPVLQYLTYLGGDATDVAQSVAVFSPTQVYVAGNATSTNFPSLCTLQGFSGTQDAFLAEFNPSVGGTASLLSANFLGGTATAEANAVGTDSSGDAILFGDTLSHDYPLAGNPQTGFQPICSSCQSSPAESDAFLTKLAVGSGASGCVAFAPSVGAIGGPFADGTSAPPLNVQVTNVGNASLNVSSVTVTGTNSTDFALSNDSCVTLSPVASNGTCAFTVIFTPTMTPPGLESAEVQMFDGVGSPQELNLSGTGTGLLVNPSPSPPSLTFPGTAPGQTSGPQIVTLTNATGDTLSVQAVTFGGNSTDFKPDAATTCNASSTISASGSCIVAVDFVPNEPSPPQTLSAQETLSIIDPTTPSTQTVVVTLSGTEVLPAPSILFSPTSLGFSSENVGSSTASQPITITNTGSAALVISSISITGTNPGDFSQTNTCPISPASLAVNANCTISVTFQPTATGLRNADLSVSDNAAGSPQTVAVSGTGIAAGVTLTPSTLTFAGQNPGTAPSAPQAVTLQNTGTGPLTISSISITGTNASDFKETDNCPKGPSASVNPNSACSIAVTFSPTATGGRTASLSVVDNAVPSTQTVGLSGLGTAPGAQLNVSTIPFNPAVVGSQSAGSPAQVTNPGNGPLTISSVSFTGVNPGDFKASGSCVGSNGASVTVAAGSNCTVNVVFAPTAAGVRSAIMNVNDNAAGSPQQVSTSGIATDFQLAVGANGSTSVTISAGETATFNLQASSINGFSGTLAMSCADPIPASTCTISPQQLNVSGSQPVPFSASITTTARTSSFLAPFSLKPPGTRNILLAGFGLLTFALLNLWKRRPLRRFRLVFLLAGALLLCSCGGGNSSSSSNGTPAGTYTVTVNGAISGTSRNVTLSVTVQ